MRLDLPTIGLVVSLVFGVNILLSVLLYIFRPTFKGAPFWILGQISLGLGIIGLFLRLDLPEIAGIALDNTIILSSSIFYAHSLWMFRREKPFPKVIYALVPLIALGFFLLQGVGFATRAAYFSGLQALLCLFISWILLYRVERDYRVANWLTGLPFILIGIASAVRVPFNLFGDPVPDFGSQTGYNALYFLSSAVVASVTLFGYFMMTSIRAEKELRARESEIRKRNQELAEHIKSKDIFFSILAHDLRGPIGGAARYVRKHLLDPRADLEAKRASIEILSGTLDRISNHLEKLLWWPRAQQEGWKPKPVIVDLARMVFEACAFLEAEATAKGLRIELPPREAGLCVYADRESVAIVLGNLLSNAIKFSPRGGGIRVSLLPKDGGALTLVEDEGAGIEEAMLPLLFSIETKQSRQGTEGESGSGLGLILCKNLILKNGGRIEVENRDEGGARVSFFLPGPPRSSP